MSSEESPKLPPQLRSRLQQEDEEVREDLEALWQNLSHLEEDESSLPSPDETWGGIEPFLHDENSSPSSTDRRDRSPRAPSRSRRVWTGVTLLLLAVAGALLWWQQPVQVDAPPGTYRTATLPDGSTVELNAGSHLSHDRGFNRLPFVDAEERAVHLSGEAYFEVAEADRPFVVTTSTARIEALGTQFNIQAWSDSTETSTHVLLTEGRVRVQTREASDSGVTLQPGQAVQVDSASGVSAPRDTSAGRVLAWRQRGMAVTGEPLHRVLSILERRSGQSLSLAPSVSDSKRLETLTLYYPTNAELTNILRDICVAKGLNYRPTQGGYILTQSSTESSER